MADNLLKLNGQVLSYHDPHQGRGGFGASTAQFLAAYQLVYPEITDLKHLLDCYKSYCTHPVSGADLLAQTQQGLMLVTPPAVEKLSWPFAFSLTIAATGYKVATHEHLRHSPVINPEKLHQLTRAAISALHPGQGTAFCTAINAYQAELSAQHLSALNTEKILQETTHHTLAAKGCGALGADVVLWIHDGPPPTLATAFSYTVSQEWQAL